MNFCIFKHAIGECRCDEGVSPWERATAAKPCVFRHEPNVCKCDQIAIKLSQDECSYAAYLLQKRSWRVQGKQELRKKAPGPPLMISDYGSFEWGLGIKVSSKTLADINRLRAEGPSHYDEPTEDGKLVKKRPLCYYEESDSITVHVMMPGQDKDGWWTLAKLLHQAEDLRDVLRVIAPPRIFQYIPFYDNSSIHNKRETLTLSTSKMGAKWGGKKPGLRDSKLVSGCIGPQPATMWFLPGKGVGEWADGPKWVSEGTPGAVSRECRLKVGDVDHGRFQPDDPPPFYELNAPRLDREMTREEKVVERSK